MTTSNGLNQDTLFHQLNGTLNKGALNVTGPVQIGSLLKSQMMEEEGIEDMHFYLVTFNAHKNGILKTLEQKRLQSQKEKATSKGPSLKSKISKKQSLVKEEL